MDTRQYDKAWCMCSALAFLQRADADEMQFYEQYKQKGFVRAKARLTDEMWAKNVFHPDEDRYIGAIFARGVAGGGAARSRASTSSSASSARTSAIWRPTRRCSRRCSTTSRRC